MERVGFENKKIKQIKIKTKTDKADEKTKKNKIKNKNKANKDKAGDYANKADKLMLRLRIPIWSYGFIFSQKISIFN